MITKSYKNLQALAKEINEPTLDQHVIDEILKQLDGSILTEHNYTGHDQYVEFGRVIQGNKKNHKKGHARAMARLDIADQNMADKQFAAASHFHYLMWMVPKTILQLIKITKILNDHGIFVIFESSSQATWSRICRHIRGGFMQIPEEVMTNPFLEDFRQDFGLANPNLSKNPTVMEILGEYKLYLSTYRYTPGEEGTIPMQSNHRPMDMDYVETQFYEKFYTYLDHQVDNLDLIVLQNDHREPMVEVLVPIEGNTIQADIMCSGRFSNIK